MSWSDLKCTKPRRTIPCCFLSIWEGLKVISKQFRVHHFTEERFIPKVKSFRTAASPPRTKCPGKSTPKLDCAMIRLFLCRLLLWPLFLVASLFHLLLTHSHTYSVVPQQVQTSTSVSSLPPVLTTDQSVVCKHCNSQGLLSSPVSQSMAVFKFRGWVQI